MIDIFSLPEIVIEITSYLSRNEFRNCALVNSSWRNTFTPFLWENVQCSLSYIPDGRTYTLDHISDRGFIKYNKYIHTLRSNNCFLLTIALTHCTNLRHVFVPDYPCSPYTVGTFSRDVMIPGMKRNPTIETLVYKTSPSSFSYNNTFSECIIPILSPLHSLKYLHLTMEYKISYDLLLYISGLPTLFTLKMCFQSLIKEPHPNDTLLHTDKTNLREMELIQKFGRSYAYLIPFMRSSPHLEKLTLPCYDPTTFTTITHLIRKSCPNITNISLDNVTTPVEDSRIAEMINSSQLGLRSISTPWPHRADFSMNALCGQSATLESVFISNSHEGIFTIVRKLLALCPNLRVLDACSGDRSEYLETEVPFKKLLMDPWIALKLQILKVPIENVFGNSKTWRYDHHNIFYNQLSKLEQLKELKVGYSTQTDKPSRNAPKFSLQSGLQLLGGLKKLEVLCVVGTNHEIQRQELEWMCKNWPKFERISGVSSIKVMDWWKPTDESRDFHSSMIPTNIRNILKPRLMSIESFYD